MVYISGDIALLILRLVLGIIFLYHGIPKWKGYAKPAKSGMDWLMRLAAILETVGGAGLVLGIYTSFAAIGPGLVMIGALYFNIFKWKKKFIGGWEYDITLLAALLVILAMGGGAMTLGAMMGLAG